MMRTEFRLANIGTVTRCHLQPNEKIAIESGSMYAHSDGITIEAGVKGGILSGAFRALTTGDSFFTTTVTAPPHGGWIDIVSTSIGDMFSISLEPNKPLFILQGGWAASDHDVELDTKWGGAKMFFNGNTKGFLMRATCNRPDAKVILAAHGALDTFELAPGDKITIDNDHLIAYEGSVRVETRKVSKGIFSTLASGEGLVCDVYGPGTVIAQTRNFNSLLAQIIASLPSRN